MKTTKTTKDRVATALPRKYPRRYVHVLLAVGLPLAVALGCEAWPDWDNAFRKRYLGWLTADGGNAIKIGNRMLWVMGDTYAHTDNNPWSRGSIGIFGNTIAIHDIQSPATSPPFNNEEPDPNTGIRFYARTDISPFPVKDITYDPVLPGIVPDWEGFAQARGFFGKSCNDFGADFFSWPIGGAYRASAGGLAFFTAAVVSPVNWYTIGQTITQYPDVTAANPASWTGCAVKQIPNQYTTATPNACQGDADPPLIWGGSIMKLPGTGSQPTYIYGTRAHPCCGFPPLPSCPPDGPEGEGCTTCSPLHLRVARVNADSALFTYPTGWEFLYSQGTMGCVTGACWKPDRPDGADATGIARRNVLQVVAEDVAPEYSVERMTWNGKARYVLVEGGRVPLSWFGGEDVNVGPTAPKWLQLKAATNYRQIVTRTSVNPRVFPGPTQAAQHGTGVNIGSTARADVIAKPLTEPGTLDQYPAFDANVVTGYNALRSTHAVKGHVDLSPTGQVHITYAVWAHCRDWTFSEALVCPEPLEQEPDLYYSAELAGAADYTQPPAGGGYAENAVSPFRHLRYPLKYNHPWCADQSPQTCPSP